MATREPDASSPLDGGDVRTWHHGLMARWWAEFCTDGDDIGYFVDLARRNGGPVLDAGCGSGRLLVPLTAEGLHVDGSDASPDMLDAARAALQRHGLQAGLHAMAMHELDLEPIYRTVVACGVFGLGGSRAQDLEGLRRLHRLLLPGGLLILDHHLPSFGERSWRHWTTEPDLPRAWSDDGDRRTAGDGSLLELRSRTIAFDPLELSSTREMRIDHYDVDGELLATEQRSIDINLYFKPEIERLLESVGFHDIQVTGNLEARPAEAWRDGRIVFHARACPNACHSRDLGGLSAARPW